MMRIFMEDIFLIYSQVGTNNRKVDVQKCRLKIIY